MSLVNLTPHPVSVETVDGEILTLPSEGQVRLGEVVADDGTVAVDGSAVRRVRISYEPATLPDPVPGRTLIVSALIAQRYPERVDLLYPAQFVRDEHGVISHARALAQFGAAI